MHIAASQNKRIFAIFGPTNLKMWSPWSNELKTSATVDMPVQTYSKNTIFQADMPCVACGLAGCDNKHGKSDCLYKIRPISIFNEVEKKKITLLTLSSKDFKKNYSPLFFKNLFFFFLSRLTGQEYQ